jgi:hypothetical protein
MVEYPRVLYRDGAKIKVGGHGYDTLIVYDDDDRAAAQKEGWSEYDDLKKPARRK